MLGTVSISLPYLALIYLRVQSIFEKMSALTLRQNPR